MTKQVDSVVRVPCKADGNFFRYWFEFLKPFHKLTEREIDVATALVKKRHELSKVIKDAEILDKVVMSEYIRVKVMEECGLSLPYFQVILSKLKKNRILVDNRLNQNYIPKLQEEKGLFKMMLLFDFS